MSALSPVSARTLLPGFLVALTISVLTIPSVQAGATCIAKTADGGLVQLQMVYAGTLGGFEKATLTIFDKDGKVEFVQNFDKAGQHAALLHNEKAIVVFRGLSGDADVFLTFVGSNQESDQLRKAIDDPERDRDSGNTMRVSIYRKGHEREYTLSDIVCRLHSEE